MPGPGTLGSVQLGEVPAGQVARCPVSRPGRVSLLVSGACTVDIRRGREASGGATSWSVAAAGQVLTDFYMAPPLWVGVSAPAGGGTVSWVLTIEPSPPHGHPSPPANHRR